MAEVTLDQRQFLSYWHSFDFHWLPLILYKIKNDLKFSIKKFLFFRRKRRVKERWERERRAKEERRVVRKESKENKNEK